MTVKRITISVSPEVAARIEMAAGSTRVSAWVTGVIEKHLEDVELERAWEAFYRDVRPSKAAQRWASDVVRKVARSAENRRKGAVPP